MAVLFIQSIISFRFPMLPLCGEKNNIIGVLLTYKSTVDRVYLPSEIFI
jgi:hypothetical protein